MIDEPQPEEPGKQPERPEYFQVTKSEGSVWSGIGQALLLHLIQVPLGFVSAGISLIFIGVSQLLYIVPAILIYKRSGQSEIVKGLIIVAAVTFLLNATCTVLFFASLATMH